jgi:methyl-accepting chemotaxis protein
MNLAMTSARSLTFRLLVPVLATTVLLYLLVFGWILVDARRRALVEAETRAHETAIRCATEVAAFIDRTFQIPRTLAAEFAGLRSQGVPSRASITAALRQTLVAEPDVLALYTLWEPDAFDGRDADFVNTPGHDASGRFIPYWNRGRGDPLLEPLVDYDKEGPGDYFLIPQRTGRDAWIEPYLYPVAGREVLITSLVSPIRVDDSFVGIAGLDIDLATLTDRVGAIKPFGTGYGILISGGDVIVAHPDHSQVGRRLAPTDGVVASLTEARRAGGGDTAALAGFSEVLDAPVYYVSTPVVARGIDTPWWLVVAIPRDGVSGDANRQIRQVMVAGAALASVLAGVLWLTARSLARDLRHVSHSVHDGAQHTAAAVRQLATQGHALSSGAQQQAASVEQTSASLRRLATMASEAKTHMHTASTSAAAARAEAEGGTGEMQRMQESLAASREAADRVARIIKTIDEIAFQTNLLALNAAVEAARAGEHGAGFAVVADEVRNLSQRAAAATRESGSLIERSQATSRQADETGAAVAERFARILARSRELDGLIGEVSAAARSVPSPSRTRRAPPRRRPLPRNSPRRPIRPAIWPACSSRSWRAHGAAEPRLPRRPGAAHGPDQGRSPDFCSRPWRRASWRPMRRRSCHVDSSSRRTLRRHRVMQARSWRRRRDGSCRRGSAARARAIRMWASGSRARRMVAGRAPSRSPTEGSRTERVTRAGIRCCFVRAPTTSGSSTRWARARGRGGASCGEAPTAARRGANRSASRRPKACPRCFAACRWDRSRTSPNGWPKASSSPPRARRMTAGACMWSGRQTAGRHGR